MATESARQLDCLRVQTKEHSTKESVEAKVPRMMGSISQGGTTCPFRVEITERQSFSQITLLQCLVKANCKAPLKASTSPIVGEETWKQEVQILMIKEELSLATITATPISLEMATSVFSLIEPIEVGCQHEVGGGYGSPETT